MLEMPLLPLSRTFPVPVDFTWALLTSTPWKFPVRPGVCMFPMRERLPFTTLTTDDAFAMTLPAWTNSDELPTKAVVPEKELLPGEVLSSVIVKLDV